MQNRDLCLYEVADRVAVLTFNRPDRLNGMTGDMEMTYYQRLLQAEADPDVRAIVVTGAGRAWCAGADLAAAEGGEPLPNTKLPTTTPLGIDKPVIAAINGACAGMGFGLALMCDFRIAVDGAKFTTAFAQRGLIAEYGLAWHLTQIAGRAVALDLLLTARVAQSAEMQALGVINRVAPAGELMAEAMDLARILADSVSPASMATIKRQVLAHPQLSAEGAMAEADDLMRQSLRGPDVHEGVT
ncbi:MAG: enoyl-CoA hydratase-related protein, partial [Acidimicrobiales bacterium]